MYCKSATAGARANGCATTTPSPGKVRQQRLLDGVHLKHLRYIDANGTAHSAWPALSLPLSLPQAIEIELDAPGYPDIRRVILLPGFQGTASE